MVLMEMSFYSVISELNNGVMGQNVHNLEPYPGLEVGLPCYSGT